VSERTERSNAKVVLASGSGRSDYKYSLDEETRELKIEEFLTSTGKLFLVEANRFSFRKYDSDPVRRQA
jgi:hypothetical protein